MRRLIINADDFGLTAGVNRAILEAHEHGTVTSATLMANGAEFGGAVQLAKSAPRLSVGCHVLLVDGTPLRDASQVRSLLDHKHGDGLRFREGWGSFARAAFSGRLVPEEIEAEATAQIRKLQSAGVAVSHLDSHKHTHQLPQALQPLLRAAKACGVRAIRNPFELVRMAQLVEEPSLWMRWTAARTLQGLSGVFWRAVREAGMLTPDGTLGFVSTGALDERLFESIVRNMGEGTWELVCHPGYNDAQLSSVRTRLRESREQELRLLTSPEIRVLLAQHSIELISYRDLG